MIIPLANGVYVDASCRRNKTNLAIVLIRDCQIIYRAKIQWPDYLDSNAAEETAVIIAQRIFPKQRIFCDNEVVANRTSVYWISRCYNIVADKVAKNQKYKVKYIYE